MGGFRFVEVLNPNLFHAYVKTFQMEAFLTSDVHKNIMDLDVLQCKLKLFHTADFTKQATSIHVVIDIIEILLYRTVAVVAKLLRQILTIPFAFASWERSSSSLYYINNLKSCLRSEEWLINLVFIFLNKYPLLIKVKRCADNFYKKCDRWFFQSEMNLFDLQMNFNSSLFLELISCPNQHGS